MQVRASPPDSGRPGSTGQIPLTRKRSLVQIQYGPPVVFAGQIGFRRVILGRFSVSLAIRGATGGGLSQAYERLTDQEPVPANLALALPSFRSQVRAPLVVRDR
jgi:hypothetical protein